MLDFFKESQKQVKRFKLNLMYMFLKILEVEIDNIVLKEHNGHENVIKEENNMQIVKIENVR